MRRPFKVHYIGDVDERLKPEVNGFTRWLRQWYDFSVPLDLRLIASESITDDDGEQVAMRFWQDDDDTPVTAELAVGTFARNFELDGPSVAYPTVLAAVARIVKYYFQAVTGAPFREDYAESWGDKVLDAYVSEHTPLRPHPGAKLRY